MVETLVLLVIKRREGERESVAVSWTTSSKIYKGPSSRGLWPMIFWECFPKAFALVASTFLDLLVTCVPLVVVSFRSLWLTCVPVYWDFTSAQCDRPPAWRGPSLSESHRAEVKVAMGGNFQGVRVRHEQIGNDRLKSLLASFDRHWNSKKMLISWNWGCYIMKDTY